MYKNARFEVVTAVTMKALEHQVSLHHNLTDNNLHTHKMFEAKTAALNEMTILCN
jgi:hypothetical protein